MASVERAVAERDTRPAPILIVALAVAGVALTLVAWSNLDPGDAVLNLLCGLAAGLYAVLGWLILRRARALIGWLLLAEGLGLALVSAGSAYAVAGLATYPGVLPGASAVGAAAQYAFQPTALVLASILFVFPSGHVLSPRWRTVLGLWIVASAITAIGFVFVPAPIRLAAPGGSSVTYPNPLAIHGPVVPTILVGSAWVVSLLTAAGFASLFIRYRRGDLELRQQVKWIAFAAATLLFSLLAAIAVLTACGCDHSIVATTFLTGVALIVFFGFPGALAIAILKYRLYEIDVIINRAVVYGLLAGALTLVYVAVVAGVGALVGKQGNSVLTVAAAVAIAVLFQPFRRRARRVANRFVYGERATPYQALSDFAERMGGTYGVDDVLQRMASIVAEGTGATSVEVWLRVGSELRPGATWPTGEAPSAPMPLSGDELPTFADVTLVVAVRHGSELLGAIALGKPRSEPPSPTERKLVEDLAAQAGLVLRNARLTAELLANVEELRASRRRLVQAQDEERRKIERNLHDGAQQQLVAVNVRLGLLERLADDPEKVRAAATQLQGAVRDALEDLRDLARGIYPPLLADKGLAEALASQGRKAVVPTSVEPDSVGRYPQEVEAAVYFCALEALQNIGKYAHASSAEVRLTEIGGELRFEISDDGDGFEASSTNYGTGLQGMADRLAAIGGALEVESAPGSGTTIRGSIPV
ncbi:MAG TPA: histidine kinase [Actinomycetota bacterium]